MGLVVLLTSHEDLKIQMAAVAPVERYRDYRGTLASRFAGCGIMVGESAHDRADGVALGRGEV